MIIGGEAIVGDLWQAIGSTDHSHPGMLRIPTEQKLPKYKIQNTDTKYTTKNITFTKKSHLGMLRIPTEQILPKYKIQNTNSNANTNTVTNTITNTNANLV